ncbi:MAG: ABC transporter permease subunit [Acidobacteria bacterium]|nr:ABC transporter permease subunit [Acidobacteriota bacterium]
MAVYEHTYRRYEGPLTSPGRRWAVIPRYALRSLFASRLLLAFYVLCLVPPLLGALVLYLRFYSSSLAAFGLDLRSFLTIDEMFFAVQLISQGALAFFLTVVIAPAMISADLRNEALPLYLSRPMTRPGYLSGKAVVLVLLLSGITWVPILGLWLIQTYLEEGWAARFAWLPLNLLIASGVWIAVLCLLGLAVSVWVKWKTLARLGLFAYFFVSAAIAALVDVIFGRISQTPWSDSLSLFTSVRVVWRALLHRPPAGGLPTWAGALSLVVLCALCAWLLDRKLRAYEVVK